MSHCAHRPERRGLSGEIGDRVARGNVNLLSFHNEAVLGQRLGDPCQEFDVEIGQQHRAPRAHTAADGLAHSTDTDDDHHVTAARTCHHLPPGQIRIQCHPDDAAIHSTTFPNVLPHSDFAGMLQRGLQPLTHMQTQFRLKRRQFFRSPAGLLAG